MLYFKKSPLYRLAMGERSESKVTGCRATPDALDLKTQTNKLKIQNIKTLSNKA
jgi:hypothetical protein